jgi:hypothetical protein
MAKQRGGSLQPEVSRGDGPDPGSSDPVDGTIVEPSSGTAPGGDSGPAGTIDPSSISGTGDDSGKRRGGWPKGRPRGRPRADSAAKGNSTPLDANALDALIFSAHGLLSAFSRVPEIALTHDESKALADATVTLAAHYPGISRKVPPEAFAWLNFAQTAAVVYGPRIAAFRMRQAQEKARTRAANGHGRPPEQPFAGLGAVQ